MAGQTIVNESKSGSYCISEVPTSCSVRPSSPEKPNRTNCKVAYEKRACRLCHHKPPKGKSSSIMLCEQYRSIWEKTNDDSGDSNKQAALSRAAYALCQRLLCFMVLLNASLDTMHCKHLLTGQGCGHLREFLQVRAQGEVRTERKP